MDLADALGKSTGRQLLVNSRVPTNGNIAIVEFTDVATNLPFVIIELNLFEKKSKYTGWELLDAVVAELAEKLKPHFKSTVVQADLEELLK